MASTNAFAGSLVASPGNWITHSHGCLSSPITIGVPVMPSKPMTPTSESLPSGILAITDAMQCSGK
jgi:hypothetical protein